MNTTKHRCCVVHLIKILNKRKLFWLLSLFFGLSLAYSARLSGAQSSSPFFTHSWSHFYESDEHHLLDVTLDSGESSHQCISMASVAKHRAQKAIYRSLSRRIAWKANNVAAIIHEIFLRFSLPVLYDLQQVLLSMQMLPEVRRSLPMLC